MSTPKAAWEELCRLQVDLDEAITRLVSARNLKSIDAQVTFARHVREIGECLTMAALQVELFARIERQSAKATASTEESESWGVGLRTPPPPPAAR